PGETAAFTLPLENYVANPNDSPTTYTSVSGTLSTTTPGVSILGATQAYPNIAPLTTQSNAGSYLVSLSGGFTPGTYVDLLLTVTTAQGTIQLPYLLVTGTPGATTVVLQENFEGVIPPALPAGWSVLNAGSPFTGA